MTAKTYYVSNSTDPTTASAAKQPTGTAIRTMLQIAPNVPIRVVEWGASFDGFAAALPGQVELLDAGTVFATMSTAFVVGDIDPHNDPNAPINTAGSTGVPLGIGAALSGYATAAVTEGAITTVRMGDQQLLPPTAPYLKQFPLGREWEVAAGHSLRIRMNFGTSVNAYCYLVFEV